MNPTDLNTPKRRRAEARTKVAAAVAALIRGKDADGAAQAKVNQRAAEKAAWIERYSRKVEAHIVAGSNGPAPAPIADAKAVQAQLTDEANAAATAAALKRLEAAEQAARQELLASEAAVHQAALAHLEAVEAEALAAVVEQLRADLERKELKLRALRDVPGISLSGRVFRAMVDDMNTPVSELRSRGDLNVPVNELVGHTHRAADAQAWRARLAELEAGDGDDTAESVAA